MGATALRRAPCRDCASGVQRIYIYNCTGNARFDAGLTNPDGTTRPAYTYLRSQLSKYLR